MTPMIYDTLIQTIRWLSAFTTARRRASKIDNDVAGDWYMLRWRTHLDCYSSPRKFALLSAHCWITWARESNLREREREPMTNDHRFVGCRLQLVSPCDCGCYLYLIIPASQNSIATSSFERYVWQRIVEWVKWLGSHQLLCSKFDALS